jgi:hypothetical protein
MHFSTSVIALAAASLASGHMIMATPKPYTSPVVDNSPLLPDGSNFPCKASAGTQYAGTPISMPIGSSQPLSFTGSAVHGGGSCQISVTYVSPPPKDPSQWDVIYSIEGGCPAKGVAGNLPENPNGDGASTYTFKIPQGVKTNTPATLAWTWFNKIGNREMYMNCAPVTFTGGSSKRDSYDNATMLEARDSSFPAMFTANIGNGCRTADSADLAFPNPGPVLDKFGSAAYTPPVGTCAAASAEGPPAGGSAPGPAAPSGSSAAGTVTSSAPAAPPSSTLAISSVPSSPPASAPSLPPAVAAPAPPVAAPAPPPAASAAPPAAGAAGAQTPQTPCSSEGMWNCLPDGASFQQCGSGIWSAVQQLAAGMKCTPGQSMTFSQSAAKIRRSRLHGNIHHRRGSVL